MKKRRIIFAIAVIVVLSAVGALLLIFGYKLTRETITKCQAEIDAKA